MGTGIGVGMKMRKAGRQRQGGIGDKNRAGNKDVHRDNNRSGTRMRIWTGQGQGQGQE